MSSMTPTLKYWKPKDPSVHGNYQHYHHCNSIKTYYGDITCTRWKELTVIWLIITQKLRRLLKWLIFAFFQLHVTSKNTTFADLVSNSLPRVWRFLNFRTERFIIICSRYVMHNIEVSGPKGRNHAKIQCLIHKISLLHNRWLWKKTVNRYLSP